MLDPRVFQTLRPFTMLPAEAAPLLNLDPFKINALLGLKPYQVGEAVLNGQASQEYDFIEEYEKRSGSPQKSAQSLRDLESQARKQRLQKRQEEIRAKDLAHRQKEFERIDLMLAQRLELEANFKAQHDKEMAARYDAMVINLCNQTSLQFPEARKQLEQSGWNYAQVLSNYKENERHESLVYELMGLLPQLDFSDIKARLQKHGWNKDAVLKEVNAANSFTIKFVLIGGQAPPNNGPQEALENQFNKQGEAMAMVEYLNIVRPLNNLYYRLYTQSSCLDSSLISYIQLTNTFGALGIQNNTTFYVKRDPEAPF